MMKNQVSNTKRTVDRRSFMKSGLLAGGAATVGVGF
jgi:TAT (twin-arginine translocation) pathway signal sequence